MTQSAEPLTGIEPRPRRIAVLSGGVSQPSSTRLLADQIARAAQAAGRSTGIEIELDVVEIRELAKDLATTMTTGLAPERVRAAADLVAAADGVIAVTPVFAASYSGLFKMFFDALDPDALDRTPAIIAATAGTPRHSLVLDHALRPLLSHLRAVTVPTGVFAATEDFGSAELAGRIDLAATQLVALIAPATRATNSAASETPPRAPGRGTAAAGLAPFTPFTELLGPALLGKGGSTGG